MTTMKHFLVTLAVAAAGFWSLPADAGLFCHRGKDCCPPPPKVEVCLMGLSCRSRRPLTRCTGRLKKQKLAQVRLSIREEQGAARLPALRHFASVWRGCADRDPAIVRSPALR